jgi:hydroxymethylpyrimidine/phosphomethylpyrimidine kinase
MSINIHEEFKSRLNSENVYHLLQIFFSRPSPFLEAKIKMVVLRIVYVVVKLGLFPKQKMVDCVSV